MFSRVWAAFNNVFDAFDDDLEEMEADNKRRMANLVDRAGVITETIVEDEVKPDGTRIKRTITTTRSKKS